MSNQVVLGLGWGDEGKGLTTSYLCAEALKRGKSPIVVRFSGGPQAGHTVVHNGIRHVFSSFGSGTLQGVPTLWSKFCPISPYAMMNEYRALAKHGIKPQLYIDPMCPVITPIDVTANRLEAQKTGHGSCGVGINTTIKRHEAHYTLYFRDLSYPDIMIAKLRNIWKYYYPQFSGPLSFPGINADKEIDNTIEVMISQVKEMFEAGFLVKDINFDHLIFEGSQGILLDQNFGFFPNVTRANTTSKNALELVKEFDEAGQKTEIYYVTRAYQTRHGTGWMSDERNLKFKNNDKETNVENKYQGDFRAGYLDTNLLKYAMEIDSRVHQDAKLSPFGHVVVTCLDQVERVTFRVQDQLVKGDISQKNCDINPVIADYAVVDLMSYGDSADKVVERD